MRQQPLWSIALLSLAAPAVAGSGTETSEYCAERAQGAYDLDSFVPSLDCAACHPQHYDEWVGSSHAYSVVDPVFWRANEASYQVNQTENFCITCHSPVEDLTDPEPVAHATSDQDMFPVAAEGVNCESCHRIYDVEAHGKQLTRCDDYYYGPIADTSGSPHGAEYADDFDKSYFCAPCHNVNISNREDGGLTQVEFTNTEWEEANVAAGGDASNAVIATCQDCHMPSYWGQAADDSSEREVPEREVHHHTFIGVDSAIVPFPNSHRQYRGVQDLLTTAASIDAAVEGDAVVVTVTNNVIGHALPTGAAHARAVWVHLRVVGSDGEVYLESGDVDENGDLRDEHSEIDPYGDYWISSGQSIFRQYMYDADGGEVIAAIGEVMSVELEMLESGEVRTISYDLDGHLPPDAAWPVTVDAALLFRPAANFVLRTLGLPQAQRDLIETFELGSTTTTIQGPD